MNLTPFLRPHSYWASRARRLRAAREYLRPCGNDLFRTGVAAPQLIRNLVDACDTDDPVNIDRCASFLVQGTAVPRGHLRASSDTPGPGDPQVHGVAGGAARQRYRLCDSGCLAEIGFGSQGSNASVGVFAQARYIGCGVSIGSLPERATASMPVIERLDTRLSRQSHGAGYAAGSGRAKQQVHMVVHQYEGMDRDIMLAAGLAQQESEVVAVIVIDKDRAANYSALGHVRRDAWKLRAWCPRIEAMDWEPAHSVPSRRGVRHR